MAQDDLAQEGVAIVGIAGQFPGATGVSQLWNNLLSGQESIQFFQKQQLDPSVSVETQNNPDYVPARGVLENIEHFDAGFFGLSPLEAKVMDPQQRLFLQVAWAALEDAGCVAQSFPGLIGVYAGAGQNTYFAHHISTRPDVMRRIGGFAAMLLNEKDYLTSRVSYSLDLKGPSLSLSTACSTSLATVFEAYQHLMTFQCDAAIAGGVGMTTPQNTGYLWRQGSIFSRTGHCRPFDIASDGIVAGNGVAVVVLKRLEDALSSNDRIYAVIRGSGLSNDGSDKVGFTAPGVEGQIAAIEMAQAQADIDPDSVGFIEAHGTATQLGDPIEVQALHQVFSSCKPNTCALGSIKSNIGHLDTAAGIAGLIKTALVLHHRQIPPTLHFTEPNPALSLPDGPFYVNNKTVPFAASKTPLRAGVSSLGLGGTNVHLVLEQAPPRRASGESRKHHLFLLSAKSGPALSRNQQRLAQHLEATPEVNLADAAFTQQQGRTTCAFRSCAVATNPAEAQQDLLRQSEHIATSKSPARSDWSLSFVFPGQGVQYGGMGSGLYNSEPVFRRAVDSCCDILEPLLQMDLRQLLLLKGIDRSSASEQLNQTRLTQPALFVVQYALAQLWLHWGIQPQAMMGHSIGEYTAACLSQVFSLEDSLMLVAERGRVIQEMPAGSMLSVAMPAEQLQPQLPQEVNIASFNSPSLCVAAGPTPAIKELEQSLQLEKVAAKLLFTSHAFHSSMMHSAADSFLQVVKGVDAQDPKIPFVSTLTGDWITAQQARDPNHWANHIKQPVQFSPGVEKLLQRKPCILLEVGPRTTTTALSRTHIEDRSRQRAVASLGGSNRDEMATLLQAVGDLWKLGCHIDWDHFYDRGERNLITLPGYAFEPAEHWVPATRADYLETPAPGATYQPQRIETPATDAEPAQPSAKHSQQEAFLVELWRDLLGVDHLTIDDNFFDLGGHSLIGVQLLERVKQHYRVDLALKAFLEHGTIRQMALQIQSQQKDQPQQQQQEDTWTPLAPIQPGGNLPPLYCVAGIGGNVLELIQLGRCLGDDIPFYGLETRGVAGHQPHHTMEQAAAENVAAIRAFQPQGPYFLTGYSAGGINAFEMAQQLKASGEQVALLAFVDSDSPTLPTRNRLQLRRVQLKRFLREPRAFSADVLQRRLHPEPPDPFAHVAAATELAVANYRPQPYRGDAVLFRTYKDDYIGDIRWSVDAHNGWGPHIAGHLTVHPVPGTHLTVCQVEENAKALGTKFRQVYLQALQDCSKK